MNKKFLLTAISLAGLLTLAACGESGGDEGDTPDGGDEITVYVDTLLKELKAGSNYDSVSVTSAEIKGSTVDFTITNTLTDYALQETYRSGDDVEITGYANLEGGVMAYTVVDGEIVAGHLIDEGKTIATSSRIGLSTYKSVTIPTGTVDQTSYVLDPDVKSDASLIDLVATISGRSTDSLDTYAADYTATIEIPEGVQDELDVTFDLGTVGSVLVTISSIGGTPELQEIKDFIDEGGEAEPVAEELESRAELANQSSVVALTNGNLYLNYNYIAYDGVDSSGNDSYFVIAPIGGVDGLEDGFYKIDFDEDGSPILPGDTLQEREEWAESYLIGTDDLSDSDVVLADLAYISNEFIGIPYSFDYLLWGNLNLFESDKIQIFTGLPSGYYSTYEDTYSDIADILEEDVYASFVTTMVGTTDAESSIYILGLYYDEEEDADVGNGILYTSFGAATWDVADSVVAAANALPDVSAEA
jgi:hypothetical protein